MDAGDRCPRCGASFVCEADTALSAPCPCFAVRLNDAARAALRARYTRCVCVSCLRAVQAEHDDPVSPLAPPTLD